MLKVLNKKQIEGIVRLKAALPYLEDKDAAEKCGTWSEMKQNEKGVYTFPYIDYEPWVDDIERALYDYDLTVEGNYFSILEENGIKTSADITDYSMLTEEVALAVFTRIIRGERFCEGMIQGTIRDGSLKQIIERLVVLAGI